MLGWFPTCSYNTGKCGALCGMRDDGQWYSKCDYHRKRHASHQRLSAGKRSGLKRKFAVMDAEECFEMAAANMNDDPQALMTDEQLFGKYKAALLAPPVMFFAVPAMTFKYLHEETNDNDVDDVDVLGIIDHMLDEMEFPDTEYEID